YVVNELAEFRFDGVLLVGHPGKLAKLAAGDWDTHSSRSASPTIVVAAIFRESLRREMPASPTVEGVFASLPVEDRPRLGSALAARITAAVAGRMKGPCPIATYLVNMAGQCVGTHGDLSPWQ
ncbi:MAG: cobalt-precorrin-6A synthase, partial [Phycisphaerae bacterium]|nr:cobalt-precorrin-6A synthase [Phycisphaerae bacterium]